MRIIITNYDQLNLTLRTGYNFSTISNNCHLATFDTKQKIRRKQHHLHLAFNTEQNGTHRLLGDQHGTN